jgi:hypothetical protein
MIDKLVYSWLILKLRYLVKLEVQSNMSRYRFLLSESWCQCWPNCVQMTLPQGLNICRCEKYKVAAKCVFRSEKIVAAYCWHKCRCEKFCKDN